MQSNRPLWSASSASSPVPTVVVCTSLAADQLDDALPRRLVVLHHQQPLHRPVHELVQRGERVRQRLLGGRLGEEVDRAQPEAALPVLLHRDDVHRDVPGGRVVLEPVEDGPAVRVGQPEIEGDGGRLVLARHGQRAVRALGHQPLESPVPRQVQEDLGEVGIVLRDEQDAVARPDVAPVVGDLALDHRREHHARGPRPARPSRLAPCGADLVLARLRPAGWDRSPAGTG